MSEEPAIASIASPPSRRRLVIEMLLLFLVLPLAVLASETKLLLPILWVFAASIFIVVWRDRTFPRRELWNAGAFRAHRKAILARFIVLGAGVLLLTWWLTPELLFRLPREKPLLYCAILVGYPWVSVYPQGVIYRAFLLHRYAALFPRPAVRIAMAALCFGFLHIIFRNPIAPLVTLIGGVLFTWTHARSRSLFVSSVEHALYGLWLMTTGWGAFLYPGTVPTAKAILFGE